MNYILLTKKKLLYNLGSTQTNPHSYTLIVSINIPQSIICLYTRDYGGIFSFICFSHFSKYRDKTTNTNKDYKMNIQIKEFNAVFFLIHVFTKYVYPMFGFPPVREAYGTCINFLAPSI